MTKIRIIAFEPGDCIIFPDATSAAGYLEPWAEAEGLQVFDTLGWKYRVVPESSASDYPSRLFRDSFHRNNAGQVEAAVREMLKRTSQYADVMDEYELESLIKYCLEKRILSA